MFGYIRPDASELKVKQEQLYRAVYCGLCKTQRRRTGFFSCMTLSYDFVFLYLFLAELCQIDTELKRRRPSLFHPDRHEYAVENGLLRYCAGCAALLNFHKMQDVARDESFFKSLLARLALPYFHYSLKKARRIVDLPEKESSFCMQELLKMENEGGYSPDEMARCSGELLSVICAYGIDDELLRCAAQRFGQTVGSWLYLVDAADDYEDDLKHRRFNPFVNGIEKEELKYALDALANDADLLFDKIPVYQEDYREIIKNVLFFGFNGAATKALEDKSRPRDNSDQ